MVRNLGTASITNKHGQRKEMPVFFCFYQMKDAILRPERGTFLPRKGNFQKVNSVKLVIKFSEIGHQIQ